MNFESDYFALDDRYTITHYVCIVIASPISVYASLFKD